jgi:DNA modification methylase
MKENLNWLPATRSCKCSKSAYNCLSPETWFERQWPIWEFAKREIFDEFERYSRRVHPAIFHRALARRIIETFSHEGETVLDLFSGVGTTLVAALERRRNAIGVELNQRYAQVARRRLAYMKESQSHNRLNSTVFHTSSRRISSLLPVNSIDLIVTSPPYWDMLKQRQSKRNRESGKHLKYNYSDDRNDISNAETLDIFLKDLMEIFARAHRVLKTGGRLVIVTGDYRRRGSFIPLHSIYANKLKNIGYSLNNIIIWDRSNEYDIDLYSYPDRFITANGSLEYILDFSKLDLK